MFKQHHIAMTTNYRVNYYDDIVMKTMAQGARDEWSCFLIYSSRRNEFVMASRFLSN